MSDVSRLPDPEVYAPKAGELVGRINDLIDEYAGEIGIAEAVGVLEIVKHGIITRAE